MLSLQAVVAGIAFSIGLILVGYFGYETGNLTSDDAEKLMAIGLIGLFLIFVLCII